MNPNQFKSNVNILWILLYGILGYEFYPKRIRTQMDIQKNQNPYNELVPNPISFSNMYPKYIKI